MATARAPLPEMTLRAAAVVPPIVFELPKIAIPVVSFPCATVPLASVPMKQPSTVIEVGVDVQAESVQEQIHGRAALELRQEAVDRQPANDAIYRIDVESVVGQAFLRPVELDADVCVVSLVDRVGVGR